MEIRFSPIVLPTTLHDLPQGYSQRLKQFHGERGHFTEEHLRWFLDWVDLEEVDHDDVTVKLFSQTLDGEEIKWYKNLPDDYILSYQAFEYSFKDKLEDKKNPKEYLYQ